MTRVFQITDIKQGSKEQSQHLYSIYISHHYWKWINRGKEVTLAEPSIVRLQTESQLFRALRDNLTSLTVSDSLWASHIPSQPRPFFVMLLWEARSIISCVTELLSDIRTVQMDDPTTPPWPTDIKPSLFCSVLSFPILSESSAAVICYCGKKEDIFPGFPAGLCPRATFWALPKEQEAWRCRHTGDVPQRLGFPFAFR